MRDIQEDNERGNARIIELESIRGIACLLVVLFHLPAWSPEFYDLPIVRNGKLMVNLFFVLSGFVINKVYAEKLTSRSALIKFQFLRFGRLYPVHLFFLIGFFLIEVAKLAAVQILRIDFAPPFTENGFQALFEHVLLIQGLGFSHNGLTFNYPAWSISVEFYTYLLFGGIVFLFHKRRIALFIGVGLLSFLLMISPSLAGSFSGILSCFAGFFIGCLIAEHVRLKQHHHTFSSLPLIATFLIILFLTFKPADEISSLLIYPLSALLLYSILTSKPSRVTQLIFKNRFVVKLGVISYSLYMSHAIVIWIWVTVLRVFLKKPQITYKGYLVSQLSVIEAFIAYSSILSFILFLSFLVYRFIEEPFRTKSREYITRVIPN